MNFLVSDKCMVQTLVAISIAFSKKILSAPGLCDPNGGFMITVSNSVLIPSTGALIHLMSRLFWDEYK